MTNSALAAYTFEALQHDDDKIVPLNAARVTAQIRDLLANPAFIVPELGAYLEPQDPRC